VQPGAIFMKFLYPAPLSSREFICGMRHTLIKLRAFSGEAGTGSPENALVGIFNDELRSRLRLRRHWRGGLCRHGALSERLRPLVRAAMTFDTILGGIVTAVVMIYLVIALIRPERF
jgi:K+-transporting ATPase KdpF subunit